MCLADLFQVGVVEAGQESVVQFQAVDGQIGGHLDPLE